MSRSREVSKARDSGLDFSNHFEIWQAPRQQPSGYSKVVIQKLLQIPYSIKYTIVLYGNILKTYQDM